MRASVVLVALALAATLTGCGDDDAGDGRGSMAQGTPAGGDAGTAETTGTAGATTPGSTAATSSGPGAGSTAPAVRFTDVTAAAGIDFRHENGARGEKLLPETMGGGVAFSDLDGDGDPDLLFVNSTRWPDDPVSDPPPTLAFFRNDGTGHFEEVTAEVGLDVELYGMGVAVSDVDGDGDPDLFVTALGGNRLFRNDGARFTDVTEAAGVAGPPDAWSAAAAFFDADGDGDADLFVGDYVVWSRELDLASDRRFEGIDGRAYLPPTSFAGTQPRLLLNDGSGTFTDATAGSGLVVTDRSGRAVGKMLAAVPFDMDGDGDADLFVANDTTRNFLYSNDGAGRFEEIGIDAGVAYDRNGNPTGAMGVDVGAFRGDDALGLFVGNFADEMTSAYVLERGAGFFTDETVTLGLGGPTRPTLTFGLVLLDADLDGRLDLLAANGHLEEQIAAVDANMTYRQPAQLFRGTRDGRFELVPETGDLSRPIVGRGAAHADMDGDGDLDVVLTQAGGPPLLLRNDQDTGHHHLRVRLIGNDAAPLVLGARVELTAGGTTQVREVRPTRSYLSQVEATLTFGLGDAAFVEALVVWWPDGSRQTVEVPAADTELLVRKTTSAPDPRATLDAARAHLENGDAGAALDALAVARRLVPDEPAVVRNQARAHLLGGEFDAALDRLAEARAMDPDDVATAYLTGIALLRAGRAEDAVPELEEAARRDPLTAAVRFQLGGAYELVGREGDALVQVREAARLDPAHSAAFYRLALAARKAGDMDGFRLDNREFLRLREMYGDAYATPVSLERCIHTNAEIGGQPAERRVSAPPPTVAVTYRSATASLLGDGSSPAAATAVIAMDDRGRYTLVAVDAAGALSLLEPTDAGPHVARPLDVGVDVGIVRDVVAGNVLDAVPTLEPGELPVRRPDLVVVGDAGVALLVQEEDGTFSVASGAGLDGLTGRRALLVDAEHDGDLDLVIAGDAGLALLLNRGDGSFVDDSAAAGIPSLGPCVDVAAIDLDGNVGVDLVVARAPEPTVVLRNLRAGRWERMPEPPGPWPAATRVLLEDLDVDGDPDAILVGDDSAVVLLEQGTRHLPIDIDALAVTDAALLDFDDDGWLDLVVVGRDRDGDGDGAGTGGAAGAGSAAGATDAAPTVRVWRNAGADPWPDVTDELGLTDLTATPWAGVLPLDLDTDGDSDLLLRGTDDALAALRNDGGNANGQLKLRLLSLVNSSGGIGTRVRLRAGDVIATRTVQRELPVEIGLAGHSRLGSIQTLWPNGIVDNRLDVEVGLDPVTIAILEQADTGSCPFLFVWNGERFDFVTDMIGSGAVGIPLSRGVAAPVNPSEIVIVGGSDRLAIVDGSYRINITSELREAAYYDHAALIAVDHPPGLEVHSTDRLRGPPFPASELWLLGDLRAPRSARGDDGVDRTAAVAENDGVLAPPGPIRAAPARGVCLPMTLELDFGPLDAVKEPLLALTGWLEYGTASTFIAVSQNESIETIWPYLEARDGEGAWHRLDVVVGLPAGKRKTILCELGGLPPGADRLRLTTTFEMRWDRIALAERRSLPPDAVHEAQVDAATLDWRGYSELLVRAPDHARTPDYDVVSQVPAWNTSLEGWCTRYGDVLELLAEVDGKVIVLNGGDVMELRVPADRLPPVPDGLVRTFAWRSYGWNKEGDPNNGGGNSIWPLETDMGGDRSPEEEDAWRVQYNTRWVPADRFRHARAAR